MRKRLIVLRHAKSAWDTDAPSDHERPLNKRGRRDAVDVAERIEKLGWEPDTVFSSDSERTKETWDRMRKKFDKKTKVVFTRDFYEAALPQIRAVLSEVQEKTKTVMVLGHNPGWEEAVSELTGKEVTLTTCNAAMLSVEAKTWPEALEKRWKLEHLVRPKG
jgi:phosphohistidine phosphatase